MRRGVVWGVVRLGWGASVRRVGGEVGRVSVRCEGVWVCCEVVMGGRE